MGVDVVTNPDDWSIDTVTTFTCSRSCGFGHRTWRRTSSRKHLGSSPPPEPLLETFERVDRGSFGPQKKTLSRKVSPAHEPVKTLWRLLNLPCEEMCRLASESLDRDLGRRGGSPAVAPALLRRLLPLPAADQAPAVRHAADAKHAEDGEPLPGTGLPDEVRERIKRPSGRIERSAIDSSAFVVRNRTNDRLNLEP